MGRAAFTEYRARPGRGMVARLGDALRRHRRAILALQWSVMLCYAVLVIVPAFLPLPGSSESIVSNLCLFAQFVFWGVWWPFVILSVVLFGRAWCGLLCPEGAMTELASRHGLGRSTPRWMRWSGWPFVAFAGTTVYGQLVSVYEYPEATLLVLGGSTVAAAWVGWMYGRGKRVWCRYLCPVSGVFALLARLAPLHFRSDAAQWQAWQGPRERVDCAPLLDLRHLASASDCHACGRCSGHRGAIALSLRRPNAEILGASPATASPHAARLLVFGMLGLATGALQWSVSPWFVAMKQVAAQWLVAGGHDALLQSHLPWWLLTNHPEAGDVLNGLDGIALLAWMAGATLTLGGATWLALRLAARLCGTRWHVLSMALVPLAGAGLFLGLSMLTVTQLRAEGYTPAWLAPARAIALAIGVAWTARLAIGLVWRSPATRTRRVAAAACLAGPVALVALSWGLVFFRG